MTRRSIIAASVLAAILCIPEPLFAQKARELSRRERKDRIAQLDQKYRDFLQLVDPIMTGEERNLFLLMESDAQRDRFIEDFWYRRDPDPKTSFNEYREDYLRRFEEAKKLFRNIHSDRGKIYLLAGEPADRVEIETCSYTHRLEVWRYLHHHALGRGLTLLFYDRHGADLYELWYPKGRTAEALRELLSFNAPSLVEMAYRPCPSPDPAQAIFYGAPDCFTGVIRRPLILDCQEGSKILDAVRAAESGGFSITKVFTPPPPRTEDLGHILRASVIANPNAPKLSGEIAARFTGKRGERVTTEVTVMVPSSSLKSAAVGGIETYKLDVAGETLKDESVFETFHYRFDAPTGAPAIPVMVERHLYPGSYKARIKVLDVNSGAEGIFELPLEVPRIDDLASPTQLPSPVAGSEAKLRILPPEGEGIVVGFTRIETIVADPAIQVMEFYLDGKKVMTKRNAPFTISLDFGPVPRLRTVRAVGLNAKGERIDADELTVNLGADPFRLHIVSPRTGSKASGSVKMEMEVSIPEGKTLRDVEIFVDDQKVATLYGAPFVQRISIRDPSAITTLRAVATLTDQTMASSEDLVLLNAPDHIEQIQVHLVELPVTVLRDGRPVADLPQQAFRIFDEDKPVKVERFEYVRNVPLSIGLVIDTSASMRPRLEQVQRAASGFLQKVLKPTDQAFLLGFDRHVQMLRKWTRDPAELATGISSLRAEQMTALHDAILSALYQFQGIQGQRAMILISDGRDTVSRFTYDQALDYAKRSGLPIYVIGIGISAVNIDARPRLTQLASETGGASFFVEEGTELTPIYDQIEAELRSQYLLAFYPSSEAKPGGDWRTIRVHVEGGKAKTIHGYYP